MAQTPEDVFNAIGAAFDSDASLAKKIGGVICFNLTGAGGSEWFVDGKAGKVSKGGGGKADCTITISQSDFAAMVSGKLNGMSAFMSGKMKIKGNMALAQKFQTLTDAAKKAGMAAPKKAAGGGGAAAGGGPAGFQTTPLFEKMAENIKANPGVAKSVRRARAGRSAQRQLCPTHALRASQVNGVFLFNISGGPGGATASWTVDAKSNVGVRQGKPAKADCTIAISDADMVALSTGKLNGMSAFMSGKMKVTGNMGLAQKLDKLVKTEGPKAKL